MRLICDSALISALSTTQPKKLAVVRRRVCILSARYALRLFYKAPNYGTHNLLLSHRYLASRQSTLLLNDRIIQYHYQKCDGFGIFFDKLRSTWFGEYYPCCNLSIVPLFLCISNCHGLRQSLEPGVSTQRSKRSKSTSFFTSKALFSPTASYFS